MASRTQAAIWLGHMGAVIPDRATAWDSPR
jgi:hypothetical protein